jgi:hypothetical protein
MEQKIKHCDDSVPAKYEFMFQPARLDVTQRSFTVQLVDGNGRPLRMQDEKHKLLKYEISIDNFLNAQKEPFQPTAEHWHPNVSEDNKAASRDDTFSFIESTVQYQSADGHVDTNRKGCVLVISIAATSQRSIDFSKVDPLSIAVGGRTVYFSGVNNGPYASDCQESSRCSEGNQRDVTEATPLSLVSEEIAKRLARALMHASMLCGGKKAVSPF